ncbi:MAG: NADH-quinone oxidoreductase subunit A [Thermoleophilia bacterium]|jgi:NADH-quinone oxidoreductase subunit A|nr:NADH-quinone oxidoreductase subunit A [Thermoleophilia bacterium]TFG70534.1 MAG: NADH-quinone oxidoreductase subunit I [Solirubrobacterales bacterium]
MLQSYLPVIVFVGLGIAVGGAFTMLNKLLGPSRPNPVKSEAYECGLPSDIQRTFRFGISFYMVAMLFILFDIEVVFLYPVGVILSDASSVFVLTEVLVFVALIMVALAYVWRRGALNWK